MSLLARAFSTLQLLGFHLNRSLASLIALSCLVSAPALAVTYSDNGDGTVTDPTTGLIWMRCALGQTWDGSTCTGTASLYTWFQANAFTGPVSFAGKSDWRVPNIRELVTIVDWSVYSPAINAQAFPNMQGPSYQFWSAGPASQPWGVDFNVGEVNYGYGSSAGFQVRLVRAGQSLGLLDAARPTSDYVMHGDGTVSHTPTGLMWKQCAEGQNWSGSSCSGTAGGFTWDAAKLLTSAFAGNNDWRLPTEEELVTLVDYTLRDPTINTSAFPNAPSLGFWSASVYANYPASMALGVEFWGGITGAGAKGVENRVRLVRAGPTFDTFPLTVAKTGTGTGTVSSALTGFQCGSTCSANYISGTKVILTATPGAGSGFGGWSGVCSGRATTCTVTMSAAQSVTADFGNYPGISLAPASLSFGNQAPGTTSAAQTVKLTNTGGAALNIASIVASGDYAVTHNCGSGLGVNGFCTLNVTFTPTGAGTRTGAVSITDNAFDDPQTVKLSGEFHGAAASLNATALSFPAQNIGTSSAAQTITLANAGDEALNLTSITASGDYAVTNNCGAGLGAGGFCSLSISFTPTVAGTRSGTVSIVSNGAGSPNIVSLNGVTVEAATTTTSTTTTTTTTTSTAAPTTTTTTVTTTTTTTAVVVRYDLQSDWSSVNNPNGVWTLRDGSNTIPFLSDLTNWSNFDSAYNPSSGHIAQPVFGYGNVEGNLLPFWFKAAVTPAGDAANLLDWQAGDIIVHTTDTFNGAGRGDANVLWTSPSAGAAHIFGNAWDGRTSLGRVNIWELWLTQGLASRIVASGVLYGTSADVINRANPAFFDVPNVELEANDTVMLKLYKQSGSIGDLVGVNLTIELTPTSATSTSSTVASTTTTSAVPTSTTIVSSTSTTTAPTATTTVASTTTTSTTASTTSTAATTTSTSSATTTTVPDFNLKQGWNLVGNGVEASLDVAVTFGDASKVTTVWKWVVSGNTPGVNYPGWAFYAPSLTDSGQTYASSKGYEFLTTVNAGEGFWVNSSAAFTAMLPVGTRIKSSSFLPATGTHALPAGWSLIAAGDSPTADGFNSSLTSLTAPPPTPGSVPANLTSLWAWDALRARWYFWAPSLVNNGGLANYLTTKGYLDFNTMSNTPTGTLSPTTGFWVNMPAP